MQKKNGRGCVAGSRVMGGAAPEAEGLRARAAALEAEGLARVAGLEAEERALRAPLAGEAAAVAAERYRVARAVAKLRARAEGLRARCRPYRRLPRRATGAEPEWYEAEELDLQAKNLEEDLKEKEALLGKAMRNAGATQKGEEVAQAKAELETALRVHRAAEVASRDPGWRDWGAVLAQNSLPAEVLEKIAGTHSAQTEAMQAAYLKERRPDWSEREIQREMAKRKREGNCLFIFARVCKDWRNAQLKVGGRLCTRVESDVLLPGSAALAEWALAEGCPKRGGGPYLSLFGYYYPDMTHTAARLGHLELLQWLYGEGGFWMDWETVREAACGGYLEMVQWLCLEGGFKSYKRIRSVMEWATRSGNWRLVQWLRGEGCQWDSATCAAAAKYGRLEVLQFLRTSGCPWNHLTCHDAVHYGHVEVLRWARENGCPWTSWTRNQAAAKLGYTDDLGNLVD